ASSGSSTVIAYSYSWPSVAVVGAVEVICGASLSASMLMVQLCVAGVAPSSPPSVICTSTSALLLPAVQLIRPVGEIVMPAGASSKLNWRSVPLLASSGSLMTSWYWYEAPSVAEVEGVDVTVGASFTGVTLTEKNCVAGTLPSSPPSATCTSPSATQGATPFSGCIQSITPSGEMVMPAGASSKENTRSAPLLASSASVSWTLY